MGFQVGNKRGKMSIGPKKYRCVYCKRIIGTDPSVIPAHEAQCDARFIVQREWAQNLAKFKRRQERMGIGTAQPTIKPRAHG